MTEVRKPKTSEWSVSVVLVMSQLVIDLTNDLISQGSSDASIDILGGISVG